MKTDLRFHIKEIWKDIPGYEGVYQISNLGNCRVLSRTLNNKSYPGRHIKEFQTIDGYYKFSLYKDRRQRQYLAHRLVAIAFIPNPLGKGQVNHLNGIKTDNRLVNLEWVTHSENAKHACKIGLTKTHGEFNPRAIMTEKEVLKIRSIRASKDRPSLKTIAQTFGVSLSCISKIIYRESWTHI